MLPTIFEGKERTPGKSLTTEGEHFTRSEKQKMAIASIENVLDMLWAEGAPDSVHVTLQRISHRFSFKKMALYGIARKVDETRGYWLHNAYTENNQLGTDTKAVVITADSQFTTEALGECSHTDSRSYSGHRNSWIMPTNRADGEAEGTINLEISTLKPLSELAEPEQVLCTLAESVNDRLSKSLGWHVDVEDGHSAMIRTGGVYYR